jgi:flagellar protein FlaG
MITSVPGVSSQNVVIAAMASVEPQSNPSKNVARPGLQGASQDQMKAVVDGLNKVMQTFVTGLDFSVDASTRQIVVRVTDKNTNQVIRQIPSEEMLRVSQRIAELLGVVYDREG